jgi:hypothetical protein
MADRSRAYVYDCCGATKTTPYLNPLTTYEKEIILSLSAHSLQNNILLIGEWQSL